MGAFFDFLGDMPDAGRTAPLVLGLLMFWILEGAVPRFAPRGSPPAMPRRAFSK